MVNLDSVQTIPVEFLGRQIGWLDPARESQLTQALLIAYDLRAD